MDMLPARPPAFIPGTFGDMPSEQYHAIEALSSGGAKKIIRSPAHFVVYRTEKRAPTPAMQFGSAVHLGVLEPHLFASQVVERPEFNRRTNAGKADYEAWMQLNGNRLSFEPETLDAVHSCIAAIRGHAGAMEVLSDGRPELSMFWNDAALGVPCKLRADFLRNDMVLADLKTTEDASPDAFGRQCASHDYPLQAAFYWSGIEHVLNESPRAFAFIAAEKVPPFGVAVYTLQHDAIRAGMARVNKAMARYADAVAAGRWDGYPQTIEPLPIPAWYLRHAA